MKKLVQEEVHKALEPFREAYAKQENENKKLKKRCDELLKAHAELVFQAKPQ